MAITIGTYGDCENAIVESAIKYIGVNITKDWSIGEKPDEFYYYIPIKNLDTTYVLTYSELVLTLEGD